MPLMAPYVNSYRRLTPDMAAPVNNAWGYDNRTTAFRVPVSDAAARRVENRLPSSDANPYLALAAFYQAMMDGMEWAIRSGRSEAFGWPTVVRVGVEAA